MIDEVIASFDFKKLRDVMVFVNWGWIDEQTGTTPMSKPIDEARLRALREGRSYDDRGNRL
jgi:hypothetical protein